MSTMSEKDRLCNVCIDEMSLKCSSHYNVSKDRIGGFVNMDCGGSQEISKQALVYMATGLVSNWKQPKTVQANSPSFEYLHMMTDIFMRLRTQGSRGATPCITG